MADTRILLVSGEYPPDVGGIADYTAHLANALIERQVDVRVLTRARPATGPDVLRLVRRWDRASIRAVLHHAPRDGIVHIQYEPAAFDLLGNICLVPLAARARRPDVRVVTTFHDTRVPYLFRGAGPLRSVAVRLLARTSTATIAADVDDLRWLGRSAVRPFLIPIGSNVPRRPPPDHARDAFRAQLGVGTNALVVAYFGLLNQSKGLDVLVEAFQRIAAARPDARLLVLGGRAGASDPTDQDTAAAFERRLASLAGRVVRPGYLEPSALSAYLLAADVALLPFVDGASARRGSLLACVEHGLPVVTTFPTHGLPADAVLACPAGDAAALARAVECVAGDADLRRRLLEGASRLAASVQWSSIAERHLAVYRATLRGRAATAATP